MPKEKRFKILYFPALTIVATVFTLLIVIAISTYRNLNRERERAEGFLLREGLALARAIEAGVRVDASQEVPDLRRLQKLVKEIAQEPVLEGIIIFDEEGSIIVAEKLAGKEKEIIAQELKEAPSLAILLKSKGLITHYRQEAEEKKYLEIIKAFQPFPFPEVNWLSKESKSPWQYAANNWTKGKMILMRLKLETFEKARREDIYHAFLMGAILVVLGSGALYFIFIVQNYYLVDRTLGRMKTYTENVLESVGEGIISTDKEGKIVTLNSRAVEILGSLADNVKGRKIEETLPINKELLASSKENRFLDQEIIFQPLASKEIPLILRVTPLQDESGQEMGSVILLRDLREVRDLQEKVRRSERLASLGRLAAGIAHEIRNPLSSIRGFAQFFGNRFQGQEEETYAAVMIKEVDRLNRVISELLDFARPQKPHLERQNLQNILESILVLLEEELRKKKIEVEKNYETDLPLVMADHDQISQAFLNLLLNSIESMGEKGKICLSFKKIESGAVEIVIKDTGRGIPAEDIEKIFEPFFSTKRKGTGLGLAIVHQIIEGHGGEIKVKSVEGKGTTFYITLLKNGKITDPKLEEEK
ncbi:MAG: two-component system sensor histidine kinase NtrB [Thermodesulfobacteriota bacterium]